MNTLTIVKDENAPEFADKKILRLACAGFDDGEIGYNKYLDQLDQEEQIYDKLETLILDSDSINKIRCSRDTLLEPGFNQSTRECPGTDFNRTNKYEFIQ